MESRRRSLFKALSWRAVALVVTTSLGYLLTGSVAFAATIGLADSVIKILAYYAHERAWNNIEVGRITEVDELIADPTESGLQRVTVLGPQPTAPREGEAKAIAAGIR